MRFTPPGLTDSRRRVGPEKCHVSDAGFYRNAVASAASRICVPGFQSLKVSALQFIAIDLKYSVPIAGDKNPGSVPLR